MYVWYWLRYFYTRSGFEAAKTAPWTTSPGRIEQTLKYEGGAGAEGAILPYVGYLQLISTLKIGADCCQLRQYKLTKPNQT